MRTGLFSIWDVFVGVIGPLVAMEESLYFSIDFWYHVFRENTVRTRFISVSPEFVEYMLKGSLFKSCLV